MGLLIPKNEVVKMGLKENQEIIVEFREKVNPLTELWESKKKLFSADSIRKARKELDWGI